MFESTSVYKVDYSDIESLINEHLKTDKHKENDGKYSSNDYELPCYEEKGNNTSLEFTVGKGKVDAYDKRRVEEKFAVGQWPHYHTSTLMNMLCDMDIIPEGEYVVSIYW